MKEFGWLAILLLAACSTMKEAPKLQDGEVALPAGYQSWPKFLAAVQRPDIKQVREIYVNKAGFDTRAGDAYPQGSTLVMENWTVKTRADGTPLTDADGRLIKDRIAKVFVMQKGPGFGSKVPSGLKNGDWAYGSYDAMGTAIAEPYATCRQCHVPLASKDFVFRYDEHFAARR